MSRKPFWISLFLLLAVAFTTSLIWQLARHKAPAEPEIVVTVIARKPERGEIASCLRYSGTLKPKNTVTIISKVPGRVERIFVEEGEPVRAGQLLAQIEDRAAVLQMQQAYAAWQAAEAQHEKAKKGIRQEELENTRSLVQKAEKDFQTVEDTFSRAETLYQGGAIPKAKLEEAEGSLRAARTELENARRTLKMMEEGGSQEEQRVAESQAGALKAGYELARLQVEDTRLEAPVSGSVAEILVDEGNLVDKTVPLLVLVQDDPILANIPLPEKYYGLISAGKGFIPVLVSPEAYPQKEPFRGRIGSVSPTINPRSRTFTLEVEIDNPARALRPGMYVSVEFILERAAAALLVPAGALLERGGAWAVFVVDKGAETKARQRAVVPGIKTPQRVEIREGLGEQEVVVVEGASFLEDGQRVRVIQGP